MTKNSLGVAIVTGASSGIGKAAAKALSKAGYRVFGISRTGGAKSNDVHYNADLRCHQ